MYDISRILISIYSMSVWHQHINEMLSDGNLASNTCRLYNPWFLIITMLHFVYSVISFLYIKKEFVLWYALFNMVFGSAILMALKPPQWYLSFQWKDCYDLYDNQVVGRTVMFSYVLLFLGSVDLLQNIDNLSFQSGFSFVTMRFDWIATGIVSLVAAALYATCLLMVLVAKS